MTPDITPAIVVLKTMTLLLGGAITILAYRAYRRTRASGLGWLAAGFGVVTVGSLLAGIADQVLAVDAAAALTIESALTAAGFAIIVYSLYATRGRLG